MAPNTPIFVSYSHADKLWLDELRLVLAPLIRDERIADFWDDTQIAPGVEWEGEIEQSIRAANVAVLLVSASFLASRFCMEVELPGILRRAEENALRIIWVAVGYSLVQQTPLWRFQAANDPNIPLDSLDQPQRMKEWVKIAETIKNALAVSAVAATLGVIDESYNLVRSVVAGPAVPPEQHPVAQHSPSEDKIEFTAHQSTVTISSEDMSVLDKDSVEFIQMHEDSMRQIFDRIKKIYPSRILPSGDKDEDVYEQLRKLAGPMCQDMNEILNFLSGMGKPLEDHYPRYRALCRELAG